MADWKYFLDLHILSNQLPLLGSKENVSSQEAKKLLNKKFENYKIVGNQPFKYDVDQLVGEVRLLESI